jgi:hypothetical protein
MRRRSADVMAGADRDFPRVDLRTFLFMVQADNRTRTGACEETPTFSCSNRFHRQDRKKPALIVSHLKRKSVYLECERPIGVK